MQDRPYQVEAKAAVLSQWDGGTRRTLLVMPTGTGKTIVFARIIEDCVRRGWRVLILAHRGELLDQAADKIMQATGLGCALEKAESSCLDEWYRIVVGSVQTLMRETRLARFPPDYFDAIVVDEAHHVLADSYQRILEHFASACVLGVTATPDRGDMKSLGQCFDSIAYEYKLPQAIRDGYLCPIRAMTIPIKIDMRGVGTQAGDYKAGEIGSALGPYLDSIADEMAHLCRDRRTVVFLPLIATSQKFRALLEARGMRAAEVNGDSDDRAEVLADFAAGKYDVLCNSMLLTEGWDCPAVDCIVVLRPTKIRGLYCQMVGRGTRIAPGKDHLLLLDFLWLSEKHELCRPAYLICEDPDVAAKMTENLEAAGGEQDLEAAAEQAESDTVAAREEALAQQLAAMRTRKRKLVDPLQYEMSIQAADLSGYAPIFGRDAEPPTPKQKERLEHAGIFPDEIGSFGLAEQLISRLDERRFAGLATPKQIRFLEGRGFRHVGTWQMADATTVIDRIAGNGWRVPYDINPSMYKPTEKPEEGCFDW